ncbi:AzlC family ABC transporter permease [Desulfosarcina sp.]|uniref:AzlC family ABC transporter permease n=1 Tax=Desulfosarcina sp. TaxID=2027861 RepID=UPI0035660F21
MTGRKDAFFGGIKALSPIFWGVTPFDLIAGISSINRGLNELEALGMSVVVFSGAAQLAVVGLMDRRP